jgi:hypothetical protein
MATVRRRFSIPNVYPFYVLFQHIDIYYWDPTGVCESGIARRADLEVLVSLFSLAFDVLPFSYP